MFRYASTLLAACLFVSSVLAQPVASPTQELAPRATQAAPHFFVYQDTTTTGIPSVAQLKGWNSYAVAFWIASGPADNAQVWTQLTDAQRASIKTSYNNAGIKLLVSAFGGTEAPTQLGVNPTTAANDVAAFVKKYNLDGVDVDYEDGFAFAVGTAEAWLKTFTTVLRNQLPRPTYMLTHAPQAPWWASGGASSGYPGGGYLKVHKDVGDLIDFYNTQYYNDGATAYSTCQDLLISSQQFPGTALFETIANGVPASKMVIGKPATQGDATAGGFMDAGTLATCVAQAKAKGWNGGVMSWQYPHASSAWITQVRGSAFPV